MICAYHADVESSAFCIQCGKPLCNSCVRQIRGNVYCEDCLAQNIERTAPVKPGPPTRRPAGGASPEVAFILGLIPGVGAIYNAEYFKAAIHLLIFGGLVTIADSGPSSFVLGLLAFGFYIYMPFEAYYTAKKRKLAREGIDLETPFDQLNEHFGEIKNKELWGGVFLIAVGALFLLDNFNIIQVENVARLWPILLIAAGVFLIKRFQEKAS
jgi:hypothetical protein